MKTSLLILCLIAGVLGYLSGLPFRKPVASTAGETFSPSETGFKNRTPLSEQLTAKRSREQQAIEVLTTNDPDVLRRAYDR
jgi:hypothetical protein